MTASDARREALRQVAWEPTTHAGLWLDKYLRAQRSPGEKSDEAGNAIREMLDEVAGSTLPDGYEASFRRRKASLAELDGGIEGGVTRVFTAEASGRLIVGLGAQSVRETSIALLHTWGVPFLPGSALKGLASAAAHLFSEATAWKKPHGPDHAALFGDTKRAGLVVFHDAWWMPEGDRVPLDLDVMTVHHRGYYRDGKEPPGDWDEPNPVAFLTSRGKYLVALSGPEAWVTRASEWLELGLRDLGIGGKTQAGYGRMTLTRELSKREIEQEERRKAYAARLASLANLPAQHKGAGTASQHLQKLREAVIEGVPAADVYAIARKLFEKDPSFWRGWAKDKKRTDEQRAFVEESAMLGGPLGGSSK